MNGTCSAFVTLSLVLLTQVESWLLGNRNENLQPKENADNQWLQKKREREESHGFVFPMIITFHFPVVTFFLANQIKSAVIKRRLIVSIR